MFGSLLAPMKQHAAAVTSAPLEAPGPSEFDPHRVRMIGVCEHQAMESMILGQIWWAPYWAVADLWWGAGPPAEAPATPPGDQGATHPVAAE